MKRNENCDFLDPSSDSDGIYHQARGDLELQMNYTLQVLVISKYTPIIQIQEQTPPDL